MPLRSNLFRGDARLEACLIVDSAHVTLGAVGDHVNKIQTALEILGETGIAAGEIVTRRYGATTAAAVLRFKKPRNIVNRAYQSQADDIVGKMTIAALDDEMLAKELLGGLVGIAGTFPAFVGLLGFGVVKPSAGEAVISVTDGLADTWARQYIARQPQRRRGVLIAANPSLATVVADIKRAIGLAGAGGVVIFNDGHGSAGASGNPLEGSVDLAPAKKMRLGGANTNTPGRLRQRLL
jgi:hypothetical protein